MATEKKNSSSKSKESKPEAETPKIEEAVLIEDPVEDETSLDAETKSEAEDAPEQEAVMVAPVPAPIPEPANNPSSFWPLLLGGIIAAVLGFLASELDLFGGGDNTEVAQLRSELASQQQRIATLEEAEPVSPDGLLTDVETRLDTLDDGLATVQERVTALEQRPVSTGDSTADTAAYENQLNALQASVEDQRTEIEGLLQNARSVEEATAEAAKVASAQAALTRIISAIDDGQPYATALADLQSSGAEVPPALVENADGVATLAALQDRFPDIARQALADARANAPGEEAQGLGGFLKRQLGARSVTPREGSDADAVLSRAEASLRSGNLGQTLTELDALPEAGATALAEWRATAESRLSAKSAAIDLSQSLTAN